MMISALISLHFMRTTGTALIAPERLPLSTRGQSIIGADGHRVRFSCINWYGAHMQLHTVGGLQYSSLKNLSAQIAALGFNCVRLPFSLQLWFESPQVPAFATQANRDLAGIRGMALFDLTVQSIVEAGLMVILNNHNSASGWCCDINSEEGLWNTAQYSSRQWLECLEGMVRRYRSNPLVVAMDLRNEIHDTPTRIITWGVSQSIDTDWKVATEAAAHALHQANTDLLILVSGLCFSFDLRKLHRSPPHLPDPTRLVWTVHYYSFARWWTRLEDQLGVSWSQVVLIAALVLSGAGVLLVTVLWIGKRFRFLPRRDLLSVSIAIGAWLLLLTAPLALIASVVRLGYSYAGCACMAEEADALDVVRLHLTWIGASTLCVSFALVLLLRRQRLKANADNGFPPSTTNFLSGDIGGPAPLPTFEFSAAELSSFGSGSRPEGFRSCACRLLSGERRRWLRFCLWFNSLMLLLLCMIAMSALVHIARRTSSYSQLHDELYSKWLSGARAPVLIGEFGEGPAFDEPKVSYWSYMTRFLRDEELDWAYWPLNGDKWEQSKHRFADEGYGILDRQYARVRRPSQLADLPMAGAADNARDLDLRMQVMEGKLGELQRQVSNLEEQSAHRANEGSGEAFNV